MGRQSGQLRRIELRGNLLAAAEDDKAIVDALHQRCHVAHARIVAAFALKGPRQAHAVVVVVQIAGTRAFKLRRIAAEMQRGRGERKLGCAPLRLGVVVDQHLVPIQLQIGHQPDAPRARGQLAAQVHDDRSLQTRGKTHIVRDPLPSSIHESLNVG